MRTEVVLGKLRKLAAKTATSRANVQRSSMTLCGSGLVITPTGTCTVALQQNASLKCKITSAVSLTGVSLVVSILAPRTEGYMCRHCGTRLVHVPSAASSQGRCRRHSSCLTWARWSALPASADTQMRVQAPPPRASHQHRQQPRSGRGKSPRAASCLMWARSSALLEAPCTEQLLTQECTRRHLSYAQGASAASSQEAEGAGARGLPAA